MEDLSKKGYIKRNGYWVSERMDQFQSAKPLCCPKCNLALQHKDDRFITTKKMCGNCWFEEEARLLSVGELNNKDVKAM